MQLNRLLILLTLLFPFQSLAQSNDSKFTKNEVLEDLDYLYHSLQEAHYNLYAYVSKEEFAANYQTVRAAITQDALNELEVINAFQQLISAANNGHTEISFPINAYRSYAVNGGTLFPLEIAFEDGACLIRKNFSDYPKLPIGAEIISINGLAMNSILARIYPQISAERPYFKNAKIEVYSFPRCYWQVFGQQDHFDIELRDDNQTVQKYSLSAVSLIEGYELKRSEVLNAQMSLRFYDAAAYLNPGNFSGDESNYQSFIDSAFTIINQRQSKNLIIDLRNNQGGDDPFSDYLVAYLADQPFKWHSTFTLKTSAPLKAHTRQHNDTTATYFQNILSHQDGEIYDYTFEPYPPQAENKRFKGQVYVLVNRQSHSQSALTAAQIQDYQWGTIVGEETGDFPTLYASQFQYLLPHTGIPVKVSKGYMVRVNGSEKQEGVIPDIFIRDHLLDENDEILEALLRQLK